MARILLIETSTAQLSAALAEDGVVTAFRTCGEPRMQAALTAPYVKEVLDEKGWAVKDLDAVCVGKGPGSYTGLRVGVSTAKGLCFGAGIPLLAAGTLDVLVSEAHRLGVGRQLTETKPVIVEAGSFAGELAEGPVLFIGDGALKCRETIQSPNAYFAEAFPTAMAMAPLAETAYNEKRFEDTAYFEPFYLKDFVATVSRKKLF